MSVTNVWRVSWTRRRQAQSLEVADLDGAPDLVALAVEHHAVDARG
jgi:hypothetical protein